MRCRTLAGRSFSGLLMNTTTSFTNPVRDRHPLVRGLPPEWAREWGEDRYGPWCALRVNGAGQRLRWVRPGWFVMGSPTQEAGRYQDEGPQRAARIAEGFWFFETPCT